MRSKYVDHSRLNSQHIWRDVYDYSMSMRNLTLIMIMKKLIIRAAKMMRQMAMGGRQNLDLLTISY